MKRNQVPGARFLTESMNTRPKKKQAGYTLMELLVAIMVGAIIMANITAVFVQQTRAMAFQEDLVDLEENLRIAMGIIYRDLRTAGLGMVLKEQTFFVGNIDIDANGTSDGDATHHYYTNNPVASDHANRIFKPDAIKVKYSHPQEEGITINDYNGSASTMQVCGPSGLSIDDVIRVVTPPPTVEIRAIKVSQFNTTCTDAACPNSDCDKINFVPGFSELNTAGGLGADYENGQVMLSSRIYYVGEDTDGNPAMFRVNNFQTPHSIIAFGIVDMQIEYGLPGTDFVTGEKVINYTTAPGAIQDVEMVKVTLTGETRNSHKLSQGPDGKSQRSITTEIQIRNLFY